MAREKRTRSSTGIYHLVIQSAFGIELFKEEESKAYYLSLIKQSVKEARSCLICYLLMDSFAHLIIEEGEGNISDIVRRANSVYCRWFRKYHNVEGRKKLTRDRFYSEPVQTESELVYLVKQIHEIPLFYGVSRTLSAYPWSSCRMYLGLEAVQEPCSVRRVREALHFAGGPRRFFETTQPKIPMLREKTRAYGVSDEEAISLFEKYLDGKPIGTLARMPEEEKRELIRRVRREEGISINQLSRITGVSRGIIQHLK